MIRMDWLNIMVYIMCFYQADPEHLINENIGWGHKISSDLLHWEECQPALLLIKVMTETDALPGVQ